MIGAVFFRYLSLVLNFCIALVVSREMGSSAKGEVTLVLTSITILQFICGFAGGQGLLYLIGGKEPHRQLLPVMTFAGLVCLLSGMLLSFLPGFMQHHALVISVCTLLSVLYGLQQTHRLAAGNVIRHSVFSILPSTVQFACLLCCLYVFELRSVMAFVVSLYAAHSIALLAGSVESFRALSRMDYRFNLADFFQSFRANFGFQLAELLQLLNLRFYFYILMFFNGSRTLGIYSVGISVLESVWVVARAMSLVRYSQIAAGGEQQSWRIQLRVLKFVLLISGLMLCVFALLPRDVYVWVFGKQFAHVKYSTRFLYPGMLFYVVVIVLESYYLGMGNYRLLIRCYGVGFIAMLSLSALFIPHFRMSGAGLVASITYFIVAALLLIHFVRSNRPDWRDRVPFPAA